VSFDSTARSANSRSVQTACPSKGALLNSTVRGFTVESRAAGWGRAEWSLGVPLDNAATNFPRYSCDARADVRRPSRRDALSRTEPRLFSPPRPASEIGFDCQQLLDVNVLPLLGRLIEQSSPWSSGTGSGVRPGEIVVMIMNAPVVSQ